VGATKLRFASEASLSARIREGANVQTRMRQNCQCLAEAPRPDLSPTRARKAWAIRRTLGAYWIDPAGEWPQVAARNPPAVGETLFDMMASNNWRGAAA